MGKHNKLERDKEQRNLTYARRFRQLRCPDCGHLTSVPGRCRVCGERIKGDMFARRLAER